jgi:hypothetical protein
MGLAFTKFVDWGTTRFSALADGHGSEGTGGGYKSLGLTVTLQAGDRRPATTPNSSVGRVLGRRPLLG